MFCTHLHLAVTATQVSAACLEAKDFDWYSSSLQIARGVVNLKDMGDRSAGDKGSGINEEEAAFYMSCTGQISDADFEEYDGLYCRYAFVSGPDWVVVNGLETGLSQSAVLNPSRPNQNLIWNFPLDISFKATNPFGWPCLAVSIYGVDFLGRDVVRGYGSVMVPITPGEHTLSLQCYAPMASSWFNQWTAWIWGNPPEFYDPRIVAMPEGREVTRVQSTGTVNFKLNVTTRGMEQYGYKY